MTLIIALILVVTILEFILCHISFWLFLALIGRIIFMLRVMGATIKVKHCAVLEGVALALKLVWDFLFMKGNIPWVNIGLFTLFGVICVVLELFDDFMFVYVTDDDEDYYASLLEDELAQQRKKKIHKNHKSKRRVKNNDRMHRSDKGKRSKRNRPVKSKVSKRYR